MKPITPNRLDWLIYRLFYWRWNRILMNNPAMFSFFGNVIDEWRTKRARYTGTSAHQPKE